MRPLSSRIASSVVGLVAPLALVTVLAACEQKKEEAPPVPPPPAEKAATTPVAEVAIDESLLPAFGALPAVMDAKDNPLTEEKIALGRALYFEKKLSAGQDVSCNTCHLLDNYGVDGKPTSEGHKKQHGTRNSPSVYNAAGHLVQFWDGRAKNVEEQAKGPITNPVEMAMPDEKAVVAEINKSKAYKELFKKAFPADKDPVTMDNLAKAIGAFERKLVTPSRWDKFLGGDKSALTAAEKAGFKKFTDSGCNTCHAGAYVGGASFKKLGEVKPWTSETDLGRYQVTKQEIDKMVFKVPSLRNVEKTAPYFHDGSVATLEEAVKLMGKHQLGKDLSAEDVASIVTWLKSLTGELPPKDYIAQPIGVTSPSAASAAPLGASAGPAGSASK